MVRFFINWGSNKGANPAKVLAQVCRRGDVPGDAIGAISVHPNATPFDDATTNTGGGDRRSADADVVAQTYRPDGQIAAIDRIDYIHRHLRQVHRAIDDGVPVVGYLAWSLMDNFEWAWGYTGRFGLVEIDRATHDRRPERSADWFSQVIAEHGISDVHEPCEARADDE